MISISKTKFILSLQKKRVRDEMRLYIIEGDKLVNEFIQSGTRLRLLAAKPEFIDSLLPEDKAIIDEIVPAGFDELKRISSLKTPHNAVAVVSFPEYRTDLNEILENLCVALDFVQDPGNLGTIIRAAAWFGIKDIVCSQNCVDVYNPKVIQASMGAILKVRVHYTELASLLSSCTEKEPAGLRDASGWGIHLFKRTWKQRSHTSWKRVKGHIRRPYSLHYSKDHDSAIQQIRIRN